MSQISFIILHYLSFETTCNCIDSILATFPPADGCAALYDIVVVDNASPNDSYTLLREKYHAHSNIFFLHNSQNTGFAKGNNLGYQYALKTLHSEFCIITNNDTEFHQKDFLSSLIQIYHQTNCAVIAPDIYRSDGYHQNPYRGFPVSDIALKRWIRNRRLWLIFLCLDRRLKLSEHISFFRNYYEKKQKKTLRENPWQQEADGIVPHGACMIFTPRYLEASPEYAYYPETFMYCEEEILAWLCRQSGLKIHYTPRLQVEHKESVSTRASQGSLREADLFLTRNMLKSLKILKRLRSS